MSSIECTVNDNSIQTTRKNPSTSKSIALPVISFEKILSKSTCSICHKESKGLHSIPNSARANIFMQ